jgi:hypothetical protein
MDYCHTVQTDVIPHGLNGKVTAFGKAIPLYNMVWHDCLVCPSWINRDPESIGVVKDGLVVPELRDARLWALLWGGPPSFRAPATMEWNHPTETDFEGDAAFIASLRPIWEFSGDVGFEPITEWEMLAADSSVQRTVFGNGSSTEVNFSDGRYKIRRGRKTTEGRFAARK